MKKLYFILSGILLIMGMILLGAALENFNPDDLTNIYTIRCIIGYVLFVAGAVIAAIGAFKYRG